MKKILFTLLALLLLTSCGPSGNQFRLAGRLRNINQGQFLVYSPDGAFVGIDTIKVQNGRFAYEKEVRKDVTLMLVFPNFSEQAVFASPGEEVEIKGDATHLKEMTITGTDENDELTKLRIRLNKLTPPEIAAAVAEYIQEEPSSMISIYLLDKYFVNAKTPDYVVVSSTDINGKSISTSQVKGKIGVISTWATWNFPSTDIQRKLRKLQKQYPQELSLISICIDGDKRECKKRVDRDSLLWTIVCDEQMFQTPIVQQLGLFVVPSMVVTNKQGKIIARDIEPNKVVEELEKFLK